MKKALLLTIALSTAGFTHAQETTEPTRSLAEFTQVSTRKSATLLTRAGKVLKGLGAGTFSLLCGALCVIGAKKGEYNCVFDPKAGFIEKAGSIGVSAFSLILAAELGNYSFTNLQEAVKAE